MNKDATLSFIKKNALSLLCGVVALAAVVAAFYPFSGMRQDLQDRAAAESGSYGKLTGYSKPRHLPLLDPAQPAAGELTIFPNAREVSAGEVAVKDLAEQSLSTFDYVNGLNDQRVHPPLVGEVLPNPLSDTPKFTFAKVYRQVLSTEPDVSGLGSPTIPPPVQAKAPTVPLDPMPVDEALASVRAVNLANDVLRAGRPPDPKQVDARRKWLLDNDFAPRVIFSNGVAVNQVTVDRDYAEAARVVPGQLAQEVAKRSQVYLDAGAFAANTSILSAANPSMADIWFAQLSLWMQTDVAHAIAGLNGESHDVSESPLKRVIRLDLPPTPMYLFPPAGAGVAGGATGGPSPATETGALPKEFTLSPTGRASNGMYDVVQFRLTADVEAAHVDELIAALTHDKLMYVYNQSVYAIDSAALVGQGYLYGAAPVVRVTLSGEELFMRKWTMPLMPDRIKVLLGLLAPPSGGATPLSPGGTPGGPAGLPGMPFMPGMPGMPPGMNRGEGH